MFLRAPVGEIPGATAARQWFDVVRPALNKVQFQPSTVEEFSQGFQELLRLSSMQPMKVRYLEILAEIIASYRSNIIHQIEIGSFSSPSALNIAPYVEGLPADEGAFLEEAQRCLSVNALRGCIVLGWCATVSRMQSKIAEIGYDKFNHATVEMAGKTIGRFKPLRRNSQSGRGRSFNRYSTRTCCGFWSTSR
jgi:hypothetical protein